MLISLITFDMTTTTINNYCDKNYVGFKGSTILKIISTLLFTAILSGIFLVLNTNIVVLIIGIISFLAGIFYTFGPIPLSRMPLGEIFSGTFMGIGIIFLSIYIQTLDQNILSLVLSGNNMIITANIKEIIIIILFAVPAACAIANIMLANNICDVPEDILRKRFTLPYYIGIENSLELFKVLYYIAFVDILLLVILRITPLWNILTLITLIPVNNNIKRFVQAPSKDKTFLMSIKNFMLINLPQVIIITISSTI